MIRFSLCVLAVSLAAAVAAVDAAFSPAKTGEKADPKAVPPAAQAIQAVQLPVPTGDSPAAKEYTRVITAANEGLGKAGTPDEVNKLLAEVAAKTVALARKHPAAESLLEGLVTVVVMTGGNPAAAADRAAAAELIRANFTKSPAIRKYLRTIARGYDEASLDVVRDVFKAHPELLTRAHAAKSIISGLQLRGQVAQLVSAGGDPVRKDLETMLGKSSVQELVDNAPKAGKEIDACRAALAGELKGLVPDLSVGAAAPGSECVDLAGKRVKLADLRKGAGI